FPTKPRVRESEGIEHGIDVVHANAVDEYICGRVVAHRNHHRGKTTKGDAGNAGCEPAYNVAVRYEVGRLHGVEIGKLQLALLRLEIEVGEDRNLDRAGLREDLILVEEE